MLIGERWFAASERRQYMFLATILLSLEVLVNDFAGWGGAYPSERAQALELLQDANTTPRTIWLDYYLPRRSNLDATMIRGFGPSSLL